MNYCINEVKCLEFLEKVTELDNTMIECNVRMMKEPKDLSQDELNKKLYENIRTIYNCVIDLIAYYNRNSQHFTLYVRDYKELIESWNEFTGTPDTPAALGQKLQIVKDNAVKLIDTINTSISKQSRLS